jgi:hypothetical protein
VQQHCVSLHGARLKAEGLPEFKSVRKPKPKKKPKPAAQRAALFDTTPRPEYD